MNDEQLNKMFHAARTKPDTARVEHGFETRLMARLREPAPPWFAWAWRLVPAFAAVVVAAGAWCYRAQTPVSIETALAGSDPTTLAGLLAGE
jgi:hypothetical protein